MTVDLGKAVAANAKLLGLGALPARTQERIALLLLRYQEDHGLDADGDYDFATEHAIDRELAALGVSGPAPSAVLSGRQPLTAPQVVARWMSAVAYSAGHPVEYGMGHGAAPSSPTPFDAAGKCDCSGLVHWGWGTRRGNYNTDGLVDDAYRRSNGRYLYGTDGKKLRGPQRFCVGVEPDDVRPGDAIVYPGPDRDHDGQREHAGHCGGVVDVPAGYVLYGEGWIEGLRVAHCRWHKISAAGGAVRVTDASYFAHDSVVVVRARAVVYT